MANGLLVNTLVLHIDHRVAPCSDAGCAVAVAEILARPCFDALSRVAINVKHRDRAHHAKTAEAIADALLATDSDAAVLDNGRVGELVASARIWTGRHIATYADPKPFLASYVVVPYDPMRRDALVDGFVELVTALSAVAGYATLERDFARGRDAALSTAPPQAEVRDDPRRARERKGHYWYDKRVQRELSGPDWGLVLGPEHLEHVTLDRAVFPIIRDAGVSRVVFLSPEPADVLADAFAGKLDAARRALAPLLMDVSKVPVA